ncbi:MAG: S8 family serine peptidase [Saprospiraceae bacterium]
MSKLTIKSGKGKLTLEKSRNLVGLKTKESVNTEDQDYVDHQFHKNIGGFNVVELTAAEKPLDDQLDDVRQKDEVEVGTHVYYVNGSDRPLVPTGEIYIVFQEGVSHEEQQIALDEFHLDLVERRDDEVIVAKVTPRSSNPIKVAAQLEKFSLIRSAEPDLDTFVDEYDFNLPTDNLLEHQWHLRNQGFIVDSNWRLKKGADAKIINAWNRLGNAGSKDVVIAVVDNGFDLTHPDLKDKVYRPFDLWNGSSDVSAGDPTYTHGTPCASVALAAANSNGIVGAAPNAKFMPVSGTSYSLRATEQMFDYCITNGADIISCSWGTTDPNFSLSPLKEKAIAKAVQKGRGGKGCIVLYAVGNDDFDYVSFYAAHPDVIAVAASTSKDQHATYSNRGREVSICAPSNGDWPITAARAWWDAGLSWETGNYKYWRDGRSRGNKYKHFGGTSSSTPLVAGICALMLSANPDLTAKQVKDILQKTADKIGSPSEYINGHSVKYGYGRVNADRAVAEALRLKDGNANPPKEVEDTIASGRGLFRFSVKRQAYKGWGVQIGAFAEYGNVLIQTERLERMFGESILVSINEINGKTVYKMVVGDFNNRDKAVKLMKRMESEQGIRGFPRNLADLK